jgi:hypothetical protein
MATTRKHYYELSEEEKIKERARGRKYKARNKQKAFSLIGDKCVICGSTKRLCFHEKHGINHNKETSFHPEDFITLCYLHHRFIHTLAQMSNETRTRAVELAEQIKS